MTTTPSAPLCEHLSSYQQGAIWNYCPDCGKRWERLSPPAPSPVAGEGEGKRPLDERLLRALSNNISGTLKPWVLQDALAHIDRWRNRAMIAEEAADQFRVELDAERAAHRETIREMQGADANWMDAANARDAAEARVRVLGEALTRYHERVLVDAMMEGPRVKGFNAHGKLAGRTLADDYDFACAALSALTSTAQEE